MTSDLDRLAAEVDACRRCELWEPATRAVPGDGPPDARLVLVGEQPGDQEDRRGEPFVGPAGRVLDEALGAAGIDRREVFVTNAVKHFRFTPRGKRRLHRLPDLSHLTACAPWLDRELEITSPEVVVALGATAGRALLGRAVKVGAERGTRLSSPTGHAVVLTTHPSAVLRLRGQDGYAAAFAGLVDDLRVADAL